MLSDPSRPARSWHNDRPDPKPSRAIVSWTRSAASLAVSSGTGVFEVERRLFVACPIGEEGSSTRELSDQVLEHLIEDAVMRDPELAGIKVVRADRIGKPGKITSQIIAEVQRADVLVADLTSLNPNVMYELGIRQATNKPSVLIAKKGTTLPFDLQAYRTVFYDIGLNEIASARKELGRQIKASFSGVREYSQDVMFNPTSSDQRDASLLTLLDSMAEVDNRTAKSLEQAVTSIDHLSDRVNSVVDEVKQIFTTGYRGAGTYLYIDGEDEAFSALTAALLRAKDSIRTTRFSPFAVNVNQSDFAESIRARVLGTQRLAPVKNFYRIVAANDMSKLDDIKGYLEEFPGKRFTLFLTPQSNNFELVIIDNSEVFIHFHDRERVIASTLHLMSNEVSKRFLEIYSSLNDPTLHRKVRKYDFKYITPNNAQEIYREIEQYFHRSMDISLDLSNASAES